MNIPLDVSDEVAAALRAGSPVVALESTIIAHGMAWPQNLEVAHSVERIIRGGGAIPATIAILDGRLKAGLGAAQLEHIATSGPRLLKVSTRDIAYAVARRIDGATTVASTLRIASLAGLPVFATGGMGGVHRGAAQTFDISADMTELAIANVALVTAGAKAILDLGLTLEKLETLGVPVVGYGTDDFPAFYSRRSGFKAPMRLDNADEVAAMMRAKWRIGLNGGIVVANPIPAQFEIPSEGIAPVISAALDEASAKGVAGKEVTPFLLARLAEATGGRSLKANIALVENNAKVAAEIAVAYAQNERSNHAF